MPGAGHLQPGLPVKGLQGLIALPLKIKAENIHNILLVLHNEDGLFLLHSTLLCPLPEGTYSPSSSFAFNTAMQVLASVISPERIRSTKM